MTALLIVSLLAAVAALGAGMRREFRKTRDADPDRTDYIARYEADLRRGRGHSHA